MCNSNPNLWKHDSRSGNNISNPLFYEARVKIAAIKMIRHSAKYVATGKSPASGGFGSRVREAGGFFIERNYNNSFHAVESLIIGSKFRSEINEYVDVNTAVDKVIGWSKSHNPMMYGWYDGTFEFTRPADVLLYNVTKKIYAHYSKQKLSWMLSSTWATFIDKQIELANKLNQIKEQHNV